MKNKVLLSISLLLVASLSAAQKADASKEPFTSAPAVNPIEHNQNNIIESIKNLPLVKKQNFVPVETIDTGMFILVKGYFNTKEGYVSTSMYLSKDLKTAIFGRAFDTKTTQELQTLDIKKIKHSAVYTYGTGKEIYYLFADPLSPSCKEFERELIKYKDLATFYIYLVPVNAHEKTPQAIEYILSKQTGQERHEALIKIANGSVEYTKYTAKNDIHKTIVADQKSIFRAFGAQSTPSLFAQDGSPKSLSILKLKHKS